MSVTFVLVCVYYLSLLSTKTLSLGGLNLCYLRIGQYKITRFICIHWLCRWTHVDLPTNFIAFSLPLKCSYKTIFLDWVAEPKECLLWTTVKINRSKVHGPLITQLAISDVKVNLGWRLTISNCSPNMIHTYIVLPLYCFYPCPLIYLIYWGSLFDTHATLP